MKSVSQTISSIKQNQRISNILTLREGQLITGKITKFFPGNKAAVSLSGHQVIAQMDASLEANKHYLMQVKGTKPAIQLKVVNQQEVHSYKDAAKQLVQANHQKAPRSVQLQLAQLLKQQLPIKPNQISDLIHLMKQNQVPNQNNVLSSMIKQNLPLNQEVFQGVHQRINQPISISQTFNTIQNQLTNLPITEETFQLSQRLSILQSKPISSQQFQESIAYQALKEIRNGSQTLFQLFKQAGVISNQLTFDQWSSQWKNWSQQGRATLNFQNPTNQTPMPFNLSNIDIAQLSKQLTNISQSELSIQENKALVFWRALSAMVLGDKHEQIGQQIKAFFQLTQSERMPHQDYPSIQSLLKTVQSQVGQSTFTDSTQQFNQVMNAMHLSNQDLTREFMSFTAQLPKETLGLNQDLFMDFEGQKQENGKLSPSHCRVIFYLDLPKLNQTVMDLRVQQDHLDLMIFHEQPKLLNTSLNL
ncbi:hypothetical protein [Piscibacillus salipiscarius]|uniref:hypothetical protein n=1 Tax=Piscibacillus salipiscarius TaxID=299480 RepID=UPI0006D1EA28|nr:hypothetical protein [Piscibacillus salipiscarius]